MEAHPASTHRCSAGTVLALPQAEVLGHPLHHCHFPSTQHIQTHCQVMGNRKERPIHTTGYRSSRGREPSFLKSRARTYRVPLSSEEGGPAKAGARALAWSPRPHASSWPPRCSLSHSPAGPGTSVRDGAQLVLLVLLVLLVREGLAGGHLHGHLVRHCQARIRHISSVLSCGSLPSRSQYLNLPTNEMGPSHDGEITWRFLSDVY